jgi:hypothetical protein
MLLSRLAVLVPVALILLAGAVGVYLFRAPVKQMLAAVAGDLTGADAQAAAAKLAVKPKLASASLPPAGPDYAGLAITITPLEGTNAGKPIVLTGADCRMIYTGLPVQDATQSRCRLPIVHLGRGGKQSMPAGDGWDLADYKGAQADRLLLMPGRDSTGRWDIWAYLAHGGDTNSVMRAYRLEISLEGAAQSLWGRTQRTIIQPRATFWRWESRPLPWRWDKLKEFVASGQILPHVYQYDPRIRAPEPGTGLERYGMTRIEQISPKPVAPFEVVFDTSSPVAEVPAGGFMTQFAGDQPRATPGGGERTTIGLVHDAFAVAVARTLADKGTRWAEANAQRLRNIAERATDFPGLYWFDIDTGAPIDPRASRLAWHRNPNVVSRTGMTNLENGGGINDYKYGPGRAEWDNAHLPRQSYYPAVLSDDPYYKLQVQLLATAALGYWSPDNFFEFCGLANCPYALTVEESRGFWWALLANAQAWKLAPEATSPASPFLPKGFFARVLTDSERFISLQTRLRPERPGDMEDALRRRYRILNPQNLSSENYGQIWQATSFFDYYGWSVLGWLVNMGRAEWRPMLEWSLPGVDFTLEAGGDFSQPPPRTDKMIGALASDTRLPYQTVEQYIAWRRRLDPGVPMRRDALCAEVSPGGKRTCGGLALRDVQIVLGALELIGRAQQRGLLTANRDYQAEARRHIAWLSAAGIRDYPEVWWPKYVVRYPADTAP